MGSEVRDVEDMPVYRMFFELALDVEKATRNYGPDFRWLRNQSLRSSESTISNMAEGFYSQYSTEYLQGLYRSRREAQETVSHLRYARGVGQLAAATADDLIDRYVRALKHLALLISSIEHKIQDRGKAKPGSTSASEDEPEGYGEAGLEVPSSSGHPAIQPSSHRPKAEAIQPSAGEREEGSET